MIALLCFLLSALVVSFPVNAQVVTPDLGRMLVLTVQPFKTAAEPAHGYLGESFSEALTTKLVGLKRIKIYERAQFHRLADELKLERDSAGMFDASSLARAGSVVSIDYMLLGSVTQSGSAIACNVRLVHVNSGQVVLAKEFRGIYPAGLFGLQDATAVAVAEALSIRLGDLELKRLSSRPTDDIDAYGLFNRSLASASQAERVKLLEAATARDPSFAMAWHLLADAYLAMGQPGRAEAAYGRIIVLDPTDYRALYNLGLLRLDDGDYPGARALLEMCAKVKPGDADVLYHIGLSYEFSASGERYGDGSDIGSALRHYRDAMVADPKHSESRLAAGTLCAILAQAEPEPAPRLAMLREADACFKEYQILEPDGLDAEALMATIGSIEAAIAEHEAYLKSVK
jgi:tetratricopeptide (TPR) repeat protein